MTQRLATRLGTALGCSAAFLWAAASLPALAATPVDATGAGIAWHAAANDADIDAAFAAAKAAGKPVFMYWGAVWCPPCNQVKATLFNRHDFIERSRAFEAVYVDGDSPGAQKIGARFRVSGYPTMVLFNPQGQEVTRLPGEVDPGRYGQVMTLALDAGRPVKMLVADARTNPARLSANDWRLLSFYAWDTDEGQVIAKTELPATLAMLAAAVPAALGETAMRLRLKSLAAAERLVPARAAAIAADRQAVLALLADRPRTRAQADVLSNEVAPIVRALSVAGSPERASLSSASARALIQLQGDTTLSRADRMQALVARVDLARIDEPDGDAAAAQRTRVRLPAPLLADVRNATARADREITDGYERQAVITEAAYLLDRSGLGGESDALLTANLARSHSPYYLMSQLAGNAKRRGDSAGALRWYRQAYERSEGPATRLQWGSSYVTALIELAPNDEPAIERATLQVLADAANQPDAFYERSGRSLQRIATRLKGWNKDGSHAAAAGRLQSRLAATCDSPGRSAGEQATCRGLIGGPPPAAKTSA